MTTSNDQDSLNSIAIVGMSGRFPGARNVDDFWENLRDGVECISTFSASDLASEGLDPSLLNQRGFINRGGILEDIELFDASFFGYNPREAEITDPQQRLFLECCWQALERGGYDPGTYEGAIGVYAGVADSKYRYNVFANREIMSLAGPFQVMLGNDKDHLTTRVAYKLNLRGPAVTVQTTCSTSLVAVVTACQSLLNYQCDMALAGGASISMPQRAGGLYQEGGISSPDGRCRAFDAKAQGTVGGNGVGVVLLKRLAQAVADRDFIHAVIKGAAINNDGATKVGYTAPSVAGQAEVIAMAQSAAGVDPQSISYVEAHGTGTPLGDPIEIAALTQVFRASTTKKNFCAVGSVKTNIGHLDPAAGVAGLIKTALALEHRMLPPSLHFEQPNPKIDFANSPFYVISKLAEWNTNGALRRAGVSSFGIGGTNAHVVLEEAPLTEPTPSRRGLHLIPISARSSTALAAATANLANYLRRHPGGEIADVAYTYAIGRRGFSHRCVILCQGRDDALAAIEEAASSQAASGRVMTGVLQQPGPRPVAFLFSGQGTQYVNMAAQLYEFEPGFRAEVDVCAELLQPHLGLDLRRILYPPTQEIEQAAQQLRQTAITQPALFVIEYALARLLMEWGLRPVAMIGHSIGEYVAACLAGVFCLADALALVAERGRLMQQMPAGAMLAVTLGEHQVTPLLGDTLALAAVNAPLQCVVSGPIEAVDQMERQLTDRGVLCRRLQTSHAFHSPMMEPVLQPFMAKARGLARHPPEIPYVSNVTGTWITPAQATDADYWGSQLRNTVRFGDGVRLLMGKPDCILLEVGPGHTLSSLTRQQAGQNGDRPILTSLRHPDDRQSDVGLLLNTLGQLWLAGAPVAWPGVYRREHRRRVPVPTYPFEYQRYWIGPPKPVADARKAQSAQQQEADISHWFYVPSWRRTAALTPATAAVDGTHWLIFCDTQGVAAQAARRLRQQRQNVTAVTAGEHFAQLGEGAYTINPGRRDDYDFLLKELRAARRSPQAILHLFGVTPDETRHTGINAFEAHQEAGCYSLLYLVQALGKQVITHSLQLGVISNHAAGTPGDERLQPAKATVLGLCKVIPQEYPNVTCRSIDIAVPSSAGAAVEKLADQLIAELRLKPAEFVVAFRDAERWVQTFEPVELGKALEATPRLKKEGVYLITGGLGGIGLVLAEHLARTERARLVLVHRSDFPAQHTWTQRLAAHGAPDAVLGKIRRLQAIEQLGGKVMVANADVADLSQMQSVIRRAIDRFGTVHGVIHAAGITGPTAVSSIQELDRVAFERHFRPKAHGLYVLQQAFQGIELDFCLLFSSLATVLGGLGFGAYGAANAFMDAFAQMQHRTHSAPWTSVDWDAWQLDAMPRADAAPVASLAERAILPEEGIRAFRRALSVAPRVVVATGSLQSRIDKWVKLEVMREPGEAEHNAPRAAHARPSLRTAYTAPTSDTERVICGVWEELLGVEKVGVHDNFFELGGHSLLAIQVISRLRDALQSELSVHALFDHPTVADLAAGLAQNATPLEDNAAKLAEVIELVEHLSEEEVRRLLEESGA